MPSNLKANVDQIVQLINNYERLIIGNFCVPAPLLGREEESNMATLFGKIRLFLQGPVQADRDWLGPIIAEQWYTRLIKIMEPDALKTIRVKAEFEPIILEDWKDMIDGLQKLKLTIPSFPDKGLLEIAGLEEYEDDLEEQQTENKIQQEVGKEKKNTQQEFLKTAIKYLEDKKKK